MPIDFGQSVQIELSADRAVKDVWVVFTAAQAETYTLSTLGSAADTRIELWQSCGQRPGELLAKNDDYSGLQSVVPMFANRPFQRFYARISVDVLQPDLRVSVVEGGTQISGTVTPVPTRSLRVVALNSAGNRVSVGFASDTDGSYLMYVSQSNVRLRLSNPYTGQPIDPLVMEAYPDRPCFVRNSESLGSCGDLAQIELLDLSGGSLSGIDFTLQTGGEIFGSVIDANTLVPLTSGQVHITYQGIGVFAQSGISSEGRYRLSGLPAGNYFLQVGSDRYVGQLHSGIECDMLPCAVDQGTPITISNAGSQLVNFSLTKDINLLIVASGGVPGEYLGVTITDELGGNPTYTGAVADSNGIARTELLRPPGLARLYVGGSSIVSKVYPNLQCTTPSCVDERLAGEVISVPDQGQLQLNMTVNRRPSVVGTVVDEATGAAVFGATVRVTEVDNPSNTYAAVAQNGEFTVAKVYPGDYFVSVRSDNYVDELYDDIPCQPAFPSDACEGGLVLEIDLQTPPPLTFELQKSGSLSGFVTLDGLPVGSYVVWLALLDENNQIIQDYYSNFDGQGNFTLYDLIPGTHRLGIYDIGRGVFPVIYDGVVCARPATSQPFTDCPASGSTIHLGVGEDRSGIDFTLEGATGRIVKVRRGDTGAALSGVVVDSWTPEGQWVDAFVTDTRGLVRVRGGFPTPGMLMSTSNSLGLVDEVYDNLPCPNGPAYFGLCSLSGAAAVASDPSSSGQPPLYINLLPVGSDVIWFDQFED